jgi:hypothetical protein
MSEAAKKRGIAPATRAAALAAAKLHRHSEETKQKIAAASRGRVLTPAHRAALRDGFSRRDHAAAALKMRETKRRQAADPVARAALLAKLGDRTRPALSPTDVGRARQMRAEGLSYQAIAEAVGVSAGPVRMALLGLGAYAPPAVAVGP